MDLLKMIQLDRLREEGARRRQEQEAEMRKAFDETQVKAAHLRRQQPPSTGDAGKSIFTLFILLFLVVSEADRMVKIKWKRKRNEYTESMLRELCANYGAVENVVLSSKKSNALVVFTNLTGAVKCSLLILTTIL